MARNFRLMVAQLNPVVGDIDGNIAKARAAWAKAREAGVDMLALPEMFVTGYNAQDLVLKPVFHDAAIDAVKALALECADGPALGIGGPAVEGDGFYNAYYVL
jgi:NAD+ synthase